MLPTALCMSCCIRDKSAVLILCRFIRILVIEIFSSILGLFGLIIGLLVNGKTHELGYTG